MYRRHPQTCGSIIKSAHRLGCASAKWTMPSFGRTVASLGPLGRYRGKTVHASPHRDAISAITR